MTMNPLRHAICAHHACAVPGVGLLLARLPVRMRDVRELDALIRPLAIEERLLSVLLRYTTHAGR